jgi:hypothetical protein
MIRRGFLLMVVLIMLLAASWPAAAGIIKPETLSASIVPIIYVNVNTTSSNSGSSWSSAYTDLQSALSAAAFGDQIWVTKGTYKPVVADGGTDDRYKAPQMQNGVAIYSYSTVKPY